MNAQMCLIEYMSGTMENAECFTFILSDAAMGSDKQFVTTRDTSFCLISNKMWQLFIKAPIWSIYDDSVDAFSLFFCDI